jgi:hypothetical protein
MIVDKITNNMVWKFNKELEYPKSIYRTEHQVILRDKESAFLFGIKKNSVNAINRIQFADKDKRHDDNFDALRYIINLYHRECSNESRVEFIPPTLSIIPFSVDNEHGIMSNDIPAEARDIINDVGVSVYETLEIEWRSYMEQEKINLKMQLAKKEALREYKSKLSFTDSFLAFFDKSKKSDNTLSPKLEAEYAKIECRAMTDFLYSDEYDLMKIVNPAMTKFVYERIKNTQLSKIFSNMVLVISIHEPSIQYY